MFGLTRLEIVQCHGLSVSVCQ